MRIWTLIPILLATLLLLGTASVANAEIILTLDKAEYKIGEIVHATAYNAGPEDEMFNSMPFFLIGNADTNECIYGCLGLPVITSFLVGDTVTMEWDTGVLPDEPGNYTVYVSVLDGPTASYLLTDAVATESPSWGTLKALYR